MTSSSLLQLPVPLSRAGALPSRSLPQSTGAHTQAQYISSPLPARSCLSWLEAPLGPQNLPSSTDPGSQGSGDPPTLGVRIRGAYRGLDLGLVETLGAVTEADVLC